MNKIIKISINDIILNPAAQSEMITNACRHQMKMYVTGLCQVGESIVLALEEEQNMNGDYKYTLAPFSSVNIDDIVSEISSRYFSGFSLIGGFNLKSEKWGLFAAHAKNN
jgi:hypothetical protein